MYNKQFINKGILYIKDILDDNGDFLTHNEMISKYKLATTFIECLQLKSCIPTEWKDQISKQLKLHKKIHKYWKYTLQRFLLAFNWKMINTIPNAKKLG